MQSRRFDHAAIVPGVESLEEVSRSCHRLRQSVWLCRGRGRTLRGESLVVRRTWMKELQVHQLNDLPRLSLHANLRHLRRRSLSLVTFLRRRDLRRQHRDHLRILFERCRRCRDLQRLCLHQRRYPCSSIRRLSSSRRHLRQRCSSKQDRRRRNHSMALRSERHLRSTDSSLHTQEQHRPSVQRGSCGGELSCSRLHQLLRVRTEFILHRRPRYDLRPHLLGHR